MSFGQEQPHSYLEINHVSHSYGSRVILNNVSFNAQKPEILALLGPSGSGKSTLLAVIAGILKPCSGQIFINGCNLLELPPESRGLGMVFQDYALWPHMTVAENVAFPLRSRHYPPQEINARVEETLGRVGLRGFERRRPHELSGGQQQRVALARAVIAEVQLLLLDEPLSSLDPATRISVRAELADILRKLDLTTIIVTHDREEAFELADRVAVLIDGQIQQHSKPQQAYERPANLTVARFMGLNLLPVQILNDGQAQVNGGQWRLEVPSDACQGPGHIAIVPERTWITEGNNEMKNTILGDLVRTQYRGGEYRLQLRIEGPNEGRLIEARSKEVPKGESLLVHLPVEAIHVIQESPLPKGVLPVEPSSARQELCVFKEEIA